MNYRRYMTAAIFGLSLLSAPDAFAITDEEHCVSNKILCKLAPVEMAADFIPLSPPTSFQPSHTTVAYGEAGCKWRCTKRDCWPEEFI